MQDSRSEQLHSVLVIDDEAHVRHVLQTQLRKAGFDVLVASDGQEGLELSRAHLPRAIVSDYQMPAMDGLALARALGGDTSTANIPIVLLTAHGSGVSAVSEHPNIVAVITKPFSPREIVRLVTSFANRSAGGAAPSA